MLQLRYGLVLYRISGWLDIRPVFISVIRPDIRLHCRTSGWPDNRISGWPDNRISGRISGKLLTKLCKLRTFSISGKINIRINPSMDITRKSIDCFIFSSESTWWRSTGTAGSTGRGPTTTTASPATNWSAIWSVFLFFFSFFFFLIFICTHLFSCWFINKNDHRS